MSEKTRAMHVPTLAGKYVRDRNPNGDAFVAQTNESLDRLNKMASHLPRKMPWRSRSVDDFKREVAQLFEQGRGWELEQFYWHDMLEQVQAFGLLSAWRLIELVSSAIWALRRDDPLCAAIMARSAMETTASYAWFQTRVRQGINAVLGMDSSVNGQWLEEELLKTLWASRQEEVEKIYNPTNIVTIINHVTNKVPQQENVARVYGTLCEVAHPNMLGRSLFPSEDDGRTVISRARGPSAGVIEHASLFAISWAAETFPLSFAALQDACIRMKEDRKRVSEKVRSGEKAR